jgi:YgiT-type zinc finger domain-containing protein
MNTENHPQTCHACGGTMEQGKTTFTVDFDDGIVVLRNVPAMVCSQCGMEWIDDETAERVETVVQDAKDKHSEVEVMSLSA